MSGHNHADVLRELVQNEYDAGGSRLQVLFGNGELIIRGNGSPIDAAGWKRLSVMLGTGLVGSSDRTIAQKVNGIGSKNFGLRTLFLYGDQIHIRSGGFQTIRLAVSMRKHGKKIDIEQPGHYFYPLGAMRAYTGNGFFRTLRAGIQPVIVDKVRRNVSFSQPVSTRGFS